MSKRPIGFRLEIIVPVVLMVTYLIGGVLWVCDLASWDGRLRSLLPPAAIDGIDAIYLPVLRVLFPI